MSDTPEQRLACTNFHTGVTDLTIEVDNNGIGGGVFLFVEDAKGNEICATLEAPQVMKLISMLSKKSSGE